MPSWGLLWHDRPHSLSGLQFAYFIYIYPIFMSTFKIRESGNFYFTMEIKLMVRLSIQKTIVYFEAM
jgi:hypothetical protein